jgi:LmbE family N-acetylglucosaminyl deacetylase
MTSKTRALTCGIALAAAVGFAVGAALEAQNRKDFSIVNAEGGHVALGLAIRRLDVAGTFMQCPAHPDDETNSLLAFVGYGKGLRVIDVQNNRGEGGQNEIGPELFRDIGVLRTGELLSAHRIDGAEQYFTRAIDYGYSWDPNEAIQKWGRDAIVGDYVRFFRTFRPEVVVTMNIQGGGGDRAHEAVTVLVREAFRATGDPTKYPEQIREGLRAWQPRKLYFLGAGIGGGRIGGTPGPAPAPSANAHLDRVDVNAYDPLLARTYAEIGTDARTNHKCQGVGTGVPALPGAAGARGGRGAAGPGGLTYTLVETSIPGAMEQPSGSIFDGIDLTLAGLAKYAGATPPAALTAALGQIAAHAAQARQAFDNGNDAGTVAPIEAGLTAVRALRAQLGSMGLSDDGRYEIDFRLNRKEQDWQDAVLAAHGLSFVAVANDGLVVPGEPVQLSLVASNRGPSDVAVTRVEIAGLEGAGTCTPADLKKDEAFSCAVPATIPASAKVTDAYFTEKYWDEPAGPARSEYDPAVPFGVPFAPTPYRATFHIRAGGVEVSRELPIEYRYVGDVYFGDKRMELNVVPAFSVRVTPSLAVFPVQASATTREMFVAVTNSTKDDVSVRVALEVPAGWRVEPASVPISFTNEDESLSAKFTLTAPPSLRAGEQTIRAVVTSESTGTQRFSNGYQAIEYPHVQRRQVIKAAEETVKIIDVKTAPVKVGYIMGVGDQVPPAIEQLGGTVTLIDENELAWGDLSKYDVIMTGVRAYERRVDLRAYNRRLLDYVNAGGTMIVNYNKTEFNGPGGRRGGGGGRGAGRAAGPPTEGGYGPYPALVDGSRVNDETVPVTLLVRDHPVFNYPNKIGPATWANWVQERGQYFLPNKDPRYVDLISMVDSFPDNPGVKLGSLVEARYGKGRWLYVGLGLWRQLPAGTDGAYQLLANLLALPKADK